MDGKITLNFSKLLVVSLTLAGTFKMRPERRKRLERDLRRALRERHERQDDMLDRLKTKIKIKKGQFKNRLSHTARIEARRDIMIGLIQNGTVAYAPVRAGWVRMLYSRNRMPRDDSARRLTDG